MKFDYSDLPEDPVGTLVTFLIVENNKVIISKQCGILIGHYVITFWKKIYNQPIESNIKIYISLKSPDNTVFHKWCTINVVLESEEVEQSLAQFFNLNYGKTMIEQNGYKFDIEDWSHYVLLSVNHFDKSTTENYVIPKLHLSEKIEIGENIIISYTPFGCETFVDTISSGIISNVFGKSNTLLLTDAPLTHTHVGAPIFRVFKGKKHLLGIIMTELPYSDGINLRKSGLSLGMKISQILETVICHLGTVNLNLLKLNSQISSEICPVIRSDFLVTIVIGSGFGTGIIIDETGIVLTCSHVVGHSCDTEVKVKRKDSTYPGIVLFSADQHRSLDIAFIKIQHNGESFPKCDLSLNKPKKGDVVYSLGCVTLVNQETTFISKGIVSYIHDYEFLTSCLVFNGSSGGAIVNTKNEVVGLITSLLRLDDSFFPFINLCIFLYPLYHTIMSFVKSQDITVLEKVLAEYDHPTNQPIVSKL